jgi:hypothetical protein
MSYDQRKITSALTLFNEKADKLRGSHFVKNAVADSGVNLSWAEGQAAKVQRRGPDQENIDAFVLTLRFFLQGNEMSSFRNLSANVYSSSLVSDQQRRQFEKARTSLNDFLAGNTMFDLGGRISRQELMDVFIFGGLSHANKEKKEKYDAWMASPLMAPFLENEFVTIVFEFLNIILFVKKMNEEVLHNLP